MKIDWEKAKLIAAKRFEDVIIACNKGDAAELQALMLSSMAVPEDYELEDEPDKHYKYLDEYNCFTADNGYICKMVQSTAPDGHDYLLPYIATKQDGKIVWAMVPYEVEIGQEIAYTDELADAIHTTIDNIASIASIVTVRPALYDEVKANGLV